jgi:hypothetical protein
MARRDVRQENANPLGAPVVYPSGHDIDADLAEAKDGYNYGTGSDLKWEFDEHMGGDW